MCIRDRYYILTLSLKIEVDAFAYPPKWIFTPTLKNYIVLFQEDGFGRFLFNSVVISAACVIISMVLGVPMSLSLIHI